MHLEDGKCAQCGKKLPRYFSYDKGSDHPYFCSDQCSDKAINFDRKELELDIPFNYENYLQNADDLDDPIYPSTPRGQEIIKQLEREYLQRQQTRNAYWEEQKQQSHKSYASSYRSEKGWAESERFQAKQEAKQEQWRQEWKAEEAERLEREEYLKVHGADILTEPDDHDTDAAYTEAAAYLQTFFEPREGDIIGYEPVINMVPDALSTVVKFYASIASKEIRKNVRKNFRMPLDKPLPIEDEIRAIKSLKLPPMDLAKLVFGNDVLMEYLEMKAPIYVPERVTFQHTHILAPSGTGKTKLMESIILNHLRKPNPPALIIIDPKGEMVNRLKRLKVFFKGGRLYERLKILDVSYAKPPALNLFAGAPRSLPQKLRERIETQTIEMLEYIFSSSDFKLTPKQSIGFSFLARLMFKIPNADIFTFLDVIEEEIDFKKGERSKYLPYIQQLDDAAQRFFEKDFFGEFKETKSQIKPRLYMVLKSPELKQVFNSRTCSMKWYDSLQNRDIVLVNTGMNQIGEAASQIFGRYVISSVYAAACARELVPKEQWNPAYLIIDEAQLYVDEKKLPQILSLVREYKLGVTLASQVMTGEQFNDNIRNAISTNTSIKYAASVEAQDISAAANDLRTDKDFIRSHESTDTHVNFACYVRGIQRKRAFSVNVSGSMLADEPRIPEDWVEQVDVRQMVRAAARIPVQAPPAPIPQKVEQSPPPAEISKSVKKSDDDDFA